MRNRWNTYRLVGTILLGILLSTGVSRSGSQTFTNPIFTSQDPWVLSWHGYYYYSDSNNGTVFIRKSKTLTGLGSATPTAVWTAPSTGPNCADVWAPEIHNLNGVWYIYYAADDGNDANHRLFVLQSTTSSPLGPYTMANTGYPNGQLYESSGAWAIDPDVFTAADGYLYVVWSGRPVGGGPQQIYIALLSDPLHIAGSRVMIAEPTEPWEMRTAPVEEGPVGYTRHGVTYITYSGSVAYTTDYTVGLLTNVSGNILDLGSWVKTGPLLDTHDTAYGPGSVVFAPSPDGTETWMIYHGIDRNDCGQNCFCCRSIRMQKIRWNADGSPLLGYAVDPSVLLRVPSGENGPYGWGAAASGVAVTGSWIYNSAFAAQSTSYGTTWHAIYRGDPNLVDYTVFASVQWVGTGTSDGVPKYGIYALYGDSNNHVDAFLDRYNAVYATYAVVGGVAQGWQNTALPVGFDPTLFHKISVSKSNNSFTFFLDGAFMQQRQFALTRGQIGLVTDGTLANYHNVMVQDNSYGWGDAFGDTAEGRSGAGLRTGSWTLHGVSGADETALLGVAWAQIFRGDPNPGDYFASVDAQWLQTGTTSNYPKYGIYAAYQDANNHVEVFIDRKNWVLATHAVVSGSEASWQNASLPAIFDPTQFHTLGVFKYESTFIFYLDGVELQQRSFNIKNGQIGLVTEDTMASYRNVSVAVLP